MRTFTVIILLLASITASAQTVRTIPATEAELAQITERGRNLAAYDVAAWHGSDAVMALQPAEESVVRYIAKRTGDGWTVAFGRLNEKRDKFLINYEAIQGSTPKEFKASKLAPAKEDAGFFCLPRELSTRRWQTLRVRQGHTTLRCCRPLQINFTSTFFRHKQRMGSILWEATSDT